MRYYVAGKAPMEEEDDTSAEGKTVSRDEPETPGNLFSL
jgi:hypothetical protein